MDLLNNENVKLGFGGFVGFALTCSFAWFAHQYLRLRQDQIKTCNDQILNLSELKQKLSKNPKNPEDIYLVRVRSNHKFTDIDIDRRAAYLNQIRFCYPNQNQLKEKFIKQINVKRTQWNVKDVYSEDSIKVVGMGQVPSNIFDHTTTLKADELVGFKAFWGNICSVGEWLLSLITIPFLGFSKKYVFIKGPHVGQFQTKVKLLPNITMVLRCNIQDGKIWPLMTATSREDILKSIRSSKTKYAILMSILAIGIAVYGYKVYQKMASVKHGPQAGFTLLQIVDCEQPNCCIICMTNCRNIVFEDCLHLAICNQCFPSLQKAECPICKTEIKSVKNVYNIDD